MFMGLALDRASRPNSLGELSLTSGSSPFASIYEKRQKIYGESDPAEYVYQVQTGAVCRFKLLSGGRRQIGAFHLRGDIFGFENGPIHRFAAEALVKTMVCLIKRQSLEEAAGTNANVFHNLLSTATSNLRHAEGQVLLLGRKSSMEKVAAFLLEMDGRLTSAGMLSLPMTRRDIADYLGVTIETVSRAVSQLQREGVLEFIGKTHREIVILDRLRLSSFDMPS
ncbi:helix-turn-helix domain-containing protein [Bradyrhizobium sp. McL0616]|uniref:helix-turn-helix domain-containing protein n=1 Tax=Bradyrhizobium sp. McL0616 TaxID=3415674 RepID=UPI003CF07CFA